MASVEVEKLSEHLLKCQICLETYKSPKVLPCLHTFCLQCLIKLCRPEERIIICPTCRCESQIPKDGVTAFSSNFFINNMLDFLYVAQSSSKPVSCTNCEDKNTATSRCIECMEFLCQACVAAHHRTKLTKDHEVLALEELHGLKQEVQEKMHRPLLCGVHDTDILKYFCETCDEPVCRECLIIDHREHRYGYLKDVDKKHRSEVGVLVMNTKKKLSPLKEAIDSVKEMRKRVDCKAEELRQEIMRTTKRCLEVIQEREEELLTQVNNIHKMKTKTLDIQAEELEMMLGNLTSSIDFTENALRHGNEAEVMLVRKQMTARLQDLNHVKLEYDPLEDEFIDYELKPDEFRNAIQKMGTVKMYHAYPRFCYATGVGLQRAKIGLEAVFLVTAKDRMNEIYSGGGEAMKVVVSPPEGDKYEGKVIDNLDGTYTVAYQPEERGTHEVAITLRNRNISGSPYSVNVTGRMDYGKLGKMMRTFGTEGTGGGEFNMPWAVAIDNDNGCFIITDCNNHRVQVFDFEGNFMFKFGTEGCDRGQFKNPRGVARFPNGQIVIADFNNHRVQIFNEDGRFIRKFGFYGNEEAGSMNHPCGVACAAGGMVLVSEQDNHRVQMFDGNGDPVRKFGCQGFGRGQFIYPHHLCVNQRGSVAVADCVNDRVQIFDMEGNYLSSFGKEGTQNGLFDGPEGITYDDEDNMLVCDYHNHRVQIFNSEGVFVSSFGQFGDEEGNFRNPCGIAVTSDGNVIVVDSGNHRIQIF
ncbi:E3 ubiquitin-protein ligase TRIM71 [Exaiptasia diaphana]|uniref:E3 ubiquitin-protein ligase TRIM71-like n=1 Tax=Exaiptasia diaphana TaxID=2652724 RepID=A0A913XFZ7_EXADI|nr:E3 ubiquitin-protein ligase TRIM71 [Exaiptasia diaphana]